MADEKSHTEEQRVAGEGLVARVKELIREGNIRRIIVKNDEGHAIIEIPLTVGVVGAVLLPLWVALGSIAALASHYTLVIERRGGDAKGGGVTPA